MSTENTQRVTDCCNAPYRCKENMKFDGEKMACVDTYYVCDKCGMVCDVHDQPPPGTGAVDVGKLVNEMGFYIWSVGRTRGDMLNHMETQISDFIKPLTAHILQLKEENERLINRQHDDAGVIEAYIANEDDLKKRVKELDYMGNLLAIIHCDGGHYRVKHGTGKATDDAIAIVCELKQKLAAALKLTTEQSITYVSKTTMNTEIDPGNGFVLCDKSDPERTHHWNNLQWWEFNHPSDRDIWSTYRKPTGPLPKPVDEGEKAWVEYNCTLMAFVGYAAKDHFLAGYAAGLKKGKP